MQIYPSFLCSLLLFSSNDILHRVFRLHLEADLFGKSMLVFFEMELLAFRSVAQRRWLYLHWSGFWRAWGWFIWRSCWEKHIFDKCVETEAYTFLKYNSISLNFYLILSQFSLLKLLYNLFEKFAKLKALKRLIIS